MSVSPQEFLQARPRTRPYRLEFRGSSGIDGFGVFAYSFIPAGTTIQLVSFHIRTPSRRHKTTFEHTGCLRHRGCIIIFPPNSTGALLNHDPDPNCVLLHKTDRFHVELLVLKPLVKGIELTINYGDKYSTPKWRPAL